MGTQAATGGKMKRRSIRVSHRHYVMTRHESESIGDTMSGVVALALDAYFKRRRMARELANR